MPSLSMKLVAVLILLLVIVATGFYNTFRPVPSGVAHTAPERPLQDARLLADLSWQDTGHQPQRLHAIFEEILRLIGQAESLIVLDMFLFNNSQPVRDNQPDTRFDPLSRWLTDALIARKKARPGLTVVVITDPFNTFYGGTRQPDFERLNDAGITLVETRLTALRDSNPWWSALWRTTLQWFGNNPDGGWLPNALGDGKVTLRSYLALPNFKANHRKTLIVDEGDQLRGLITSANPHAGSSKHWNTALSFQGAAAADLLETELAVLAFSGVSVPEVLRSAVADHQTRPSPPAGPVTGRIVTESAIRDAALTLIDTAAPGDRLDLAVFYLSHRGIIEALKSAGSRGVTVRVLLDRNEEAFGRAKNGIPNRQAAMELTRAGLEVRWCNTHGEQCHNKFLFRQASDGQSSLLIGSANFTRRNLDDFNLETDVLLTGPADETPLAGTAALFERLWQGPDPGQLPGIPEEAVFSLDYSQNMDESGLRYWRYRVMEASGLSTF